MLSRDRRPRASLGALDIMLLSTLPFRFEVRCCVSYVLSVAPSSDGRPSRASLGARFLRILTGTLVVTLSSAGRALISLKHGLGVPNPDDLISLPPLLF
jgi:hypothetical protein